jgi:CheY-like chemotaxis protein
MPEVDGLKATRLIRQDEQRRTGTQPHVPIVAVTAHASKQQHKQCIAEGMDAVITKPVRCDALLSCIGEVLRSTVVVGQ